MRGRKAVSPSSLRNAILDESRSSHFAIVKCKVRAPAQYEYAKIYGSSSRHAPAESSATSASASASTQPSQPLVQASLQQIFESCVEY
ncbi:hypothetical protein EVAR_95558_1 [Eumeta japonica]|uniref:Uncharacterized protein n=1 Tax=Eumeta variegata TaxID=151549 RepID=A0A4C2A2P4_EUMVA|nr:hypothetical protein EVAR_95558_1 [Eumeta japonica]